MLYAIELLERILNIQSPFVVSVDVMIININKSRAVTLYLIKHRILIRGVFITYDVITRDVLSII